MSMRGIIGAAILITVLVTGCRGNAPAGGNGDNGNTGVSIAGDNAISWPRQADHVIFEINITGGPENFERRNDVPLCAVYGDNRVVYLDTSNPNRTQILFDVLDDLAIYNFVSDLAVNERIYTYESLMEQQLVGDTPPVFEQIILNVNDERHVTDGFANWPTGYFRGILETCTTLTETPALFEPAGGWLSAEFVDFEPQATIIHWKAEESGIDLNALSDETGRIWVDDPTLVTILWNIAMNSPRNRLFSQTNGYFQVAFEIPNVHPSAPPAPAPEELEQARTLPSEREEDTEG